MSVKRKTPSLNPQCIDDFNWYYEYPHRIEVVHEIYMPNGYLRTDIIRIPKKKLKESLERMGTVKKRGR